MRQTSETIFLCVCTRYAGACICCSSFFFLFFFATARMIRAIILPWTVYYGYSYGGCSRRRYSQKNIYLHTHKFRSVRFSFSHNISVLLLWFLSFQQICKSHSISRQSAAILFWNRIASPLHQACQNWWWSLTSYTHNQHHDMRANIQTPQYID